MGNREPAMQLEPHRITIPHGYTVFGKMFEMPLECLFGYSGDLKTNHALEIKSLTGKDTDGLTFDMMYLVEDEGSELTKHIISCILNNYSIWDTDTETGEWWDNHNRGIETPY